MKQKQYSPQPVADMAIVLYAANEGFLKEIELQKIADFESALLSYMSSEYSDLMNTINESGDYNDDIQASLKEAMDKFISTQSW